ncbi:MAG: NDP-sugar synthase [Duncaniella sp.]|nr:NDP-sugar synthase [Duncaniella sp.]
MDYAIIAAGQGSRLGGEGATLPKPLVTVGGQPMISRLVGQLDSMGAGRICVITNPAMPAVAETVRSLEVSAPVSLVEKSTGGSMESFHALAPTLDPEHDFCLLTVDTVFDPVEFRRFIEAFEADSSSDGYMAVTTYMADEKPLYVAATATDDITGFLDRPVAGVRYVSGGIYALRPAALGILADCAASGVSRMRDFQRALVASGMRLKAWPFTKIIDVDRPEDLAEAGRFVGGLT